MKGHLLLAEHITIGVNGMFSALDAGFTHLLVPAAHPPNELYQRQCSILIGFRAEDGNDAGSYPFRLMLEHPEYEPVEIFNGTATVPANGNIYAVLPGHFYLRYPTGYTLRLYIVRGTGEAAEPEEVADLGFSVARIEMPSMNHPTSDPYSGGMAPFGAQPGIPLGAVPAELLDDGEGGGDSSGDADVPPADYDPSADLEGIDWEGDSTGSGDGDALA